MRVFKLSKKHLGFTIVELIIVISVIGILAAITMVTYKNVAGKAGAASYSSAVDAIQKALIIEYTQKRTLPEGKGCLIQHEYALPAASGFGDSVCLHNPQEIMDQGSVAFDQNFINQFSPATIESFPSAPLPIATLNTDEYKSRAILYEGEKIGNEFRVYLFWLTPSRDNCGRGMNAYAGYDELSPESRAEMRGYIEEFNQQAQNPELSEEERQMYQLYANIYSLFMGDTEETMCMLELRL